MTSLTALLPVAQGVAAYAALARAAETARSAGDERSRGQVMANTLVERVTGTPAGISGVEIQLVMTDRALLHADAEPAGFPGTAPLPHAGPETSPLPIHQPRECRQQTQAPAALVLLPLTAPPARVSQARVPQATSRCCSPGA